MEFADFLNALFYFINKGLLNAVKIGSIYALGAVGVTLIFGILRFAHFAHAELMTFAALCCVMITYGLRMMGINSEPIPTALLAMPLALVLTVIAAQVIDKSVYAHFRRQKSPPVVLLMVSFGVTFVLQGLIRLFGGTGDRQLFMSLTVNGVESVERKEVLVFNLDFIRQAVEGFSQKIVLTVPQIALFTITLFSFVALHLFLTKTRMGKAMRAVSDNEDLARASGIDLNKVVRATWLIGGTLAGCAGIMLALDNQYKPDLAFNLLLPIFASAIIGGVGHPYGAAVGGFIVALTETFAVFDWRVILNYFLDEAHQFDGPVALVDSEYKLAIPFVLLILILIYKPTGLFKGKVI